MLSPRTLLIATLVASLLPLSATRADEPCNSCQPAKQPSYTFCRGCLKKDRPPYVHPDTPFGYYPTVWMAWPGPSCGQYPAMHTNVAPPLAPPNEAEPLPAPRPAETRAAPRDDSTPTVLAPPSK